MCIGIYWEVKQTKRETYLHHLNETINKYYAVE
jgi:hypothetical protein